MATVASATLLNACDTVQDRRRDNPTGEEALPAQNIGDTGATMPVDISIHIASLGISDQTPPHDTRPSWIRRDTDDCLYLVRTMLRMEQDLVGLHVRLRIAKALCSAPNTFDERPRLLGWLRDHLPMEWSQRRRLQLVGGEQMRVDVLPDPGTSQADDIDLTVTLTDACADDLRRQFQPLCEANRKFQAAIATLSEMTACGMASIQAQQYQVWDLYHFIAANNLAAAHDYETGCNADSLARLRGGLEEILRRKNPRHPTTMHYLEDISIALGRIRTITAWDEPPPSSHTVDRLLPPASS